MREKINLNMTPWDLAVLLSEGNPGGLSVVMQILNGPQPLALLSMDDMNIRGTQIWVGYKDYCGEDIDKFLKCLKDRDQSMVDTINNECIFDNEYGKFTERARINRLSV